ncbi:PspC domain-containing protein [uncultured Ruminococcus sp.]|uniref:PspC domain-containing protein n=1 Tax=uncultured Ruminococcus sp. TaxID=165186 RepID=UPI000ED5BC54|nr:PspC domain-containing protein [uncultured Ruminococcus sp.]HCJ40427.1 PspC domain-containing protein [Ruminococcus sp.]
MNGKRLYRIRNGAKISGVCMGLAEYLGIDVNIIRILAVVSLFCGGFGFLAYIVAVMILPEI